MAKPKTRKQFFAKQHMICKTKKSYATDMEAAHIAGLQALKWKTRLFIYKCPVGDHWHLSRSEKCLQPLNKVNKSTSTPTELYTKDTTKVTSLSQAS